MSSTYRYRSICSSKARYVFSSGPIYLKNLSFTTCPICEAYKYSDVPAMVAIVIGK